MNTLLDAIEDILRPDLVYKSGMVRLEETAEGSTCGAVTLNKSGRAVVLKLDGLPPPICAQQGCQMRYSVNDRLFPLFKPGTSGLSALCDYLIFYLEKDVENPRLFVFLCELKSGRPTGAVKQAENGKLMADYIIAMAKHHRNLTSLPQCEARGLVFSPRYAPAKVLNRSSRADYSSHAKRIPGMKFAYYRPGDYSLAYFCA